MGLAPRRCLALQALLERWLMTLLCRRSGSAASIGLPAALRRTSSRSA